MKKNSYSEGFTGPEWHDAQKNEPRLTWLNWRNFLFRALVLVAAIQGGTWGYATANDQVAQDTATNTPQTITERSKCEDELTFENSAHRAWYKVFWTGNCDELPWFERFVCVEGEPTWTEVTQMIVGKATTDTQKALQNKMTRLGRMIGHEWARDNDDRRIDSDDLILWYEWLNKSTDVTGVVARLSQAVQDKLDQP